MFNTGLGDWFNLRSEQALEILASDRKGDNGGLPRAAVCCYMTCGCELSMAAMLLWSLHCFVLLGVFPFSGICLDCVTSHSL